MTTILNTVTATDTGAKIVFDLGDDVAVVEFGNGRMVIADVSDMVSYDEIMPISNAFKFSDEVSYDDRIARMVAKYRA